MSQGDIRKARQELFAALGPFVTTRKKNDFLLFKAREHLSKYEPFLRSLPNGAFSHYERFKEFLKKDDAQTHSFGVLVRSTQQDKKRACEELWAFFIAAM